MLMGKGPAVPRVAKYSKSALAGKLDGVFRAYGYEGASLAMLSSATGLSKASLYHHFPRGKEDMAAHVLARSGAQLQQLVLAPLSTKDDPLDRLKASLDGAARYYAGDVPMCLMNSLMVGDGASLYGKQVHQAVKAWMRGLAGALADGGIAVDAADAWAQAAIERLQGALVLCRVSSSREALEACLEDLALSAGNLLA